jgi:hypothetical protein
MTRSFTTSPGKSTPYCGLKSTIYPANIDKYVQNHQKLTCYLWIILRKHRRGYGQLEVHKLQNVVNIHPKGVGNEI